MTDLDLVEIRLEGPGKNALGSRVLRFLAESMEAAGDRPILLTGTGDAFSAGLDLRELVTFDAEQMRQFLGGLADVVERLFRHPAPTVAAVNGHAIAGGAVLAAACDHRIGPTSPAARISLNEVALGVRFPPGILEVVRHRVARIETVALGAELHPPAEAVRLGLLDELADDPVAAGRDRLRFLAGHPREAYAATKTALRAAVITRNDAIEREFLDEVLPIWTSSGLKDRIRAFLDRKLDPKR